MLKNVKVWCDQICDCFWLVIMPGRRKLRSTMWAGIAELLGTKGGFHTDFLSLWT